MASIGVIGSGIVGLTTASLLQDALPSSQITVIGEEFGERTTSFGAAGNFFPDPSVTLSTDPVRLHRWFKASFDHFYNLAFSDEAYAAGVSLLPFMLFMDRSPLELDFLERYSINLRQMTADHLRRMRVPSQHKTGHIFDSFLIESRYHMPYLKDKLLRHNASFEQRRVDKVQDLSGEFDVLVNCSGLASRQLFNDTNIRGTRGQLVRVHAPWIKHAYMAKDTYIFPARESVVLGGFYQVGNEDLAVSAADTEDILRRTQQFAPSLRGATVLEEWVGLRPHRDQLRLEADFESCGIPVVHNYGHHNKGVSLSYGTAVEAVEITTKILRRSKL